MADSSMTSPKKDLKGSPSRDAFKHFHKTGPRELYASDLDLVCVHKNPPGIVAAIDYKTPHDSVSFAEVILYNALLSFSVPVYIITSVEPFETFTIEQYTGGNHIPNPPAVNMITIHKDIDREAFWAWERALRASYQAKPRLAKAIQPALTDEQIKTAILKKGFVQAWAFVGELLSEVMALITTKQANSA
jgi:hypothetical protein